ncbi:MAG: U32 family peptidase [Clostridia bacterium]|nr:U32 family peptidase [Clostridia bacterium]
MLELLAPVGDMSCFDAAINCGADAVYLGLSDFNARRKAENFTADSLRSCVRKAHFYGVKVYITVNTLVKDSEISSLLSTVRAAVEAKADAFIVQDLGVATLLKRAFPNIVLHASTQLGVHNLYGALQAEKFGFTRVVLSRETKLADIREIRRNTNLEIEYFVQGALCVAFSGNCYLSAAERGASGNRGLCRQLCRLPYTAKIDGYTKSGYMLSARDLCLADSLRELKDAGVTSFKIEGRMRREGYVARAVSVYRGLLDGLESGAKLTKDDRERLQLAYSRGDSYLERAYLDNGTPSVIDRVYNNHTGISVGEVKDVKPFKSDLYKVTLFSSRTLNVGDGLKFFDKDNKEVASVGLGDVKPLGKDTYSFVTKSRLQAGWKTRLISSEIQEKELQATKREVYIDLEIEAQVGKPLSITACCDVDGKRVTVSECGGVCERAKTSPTSDDDIRAQAVKTSNSGFTVRNCSVKTDVVFIPKSAINALRRSVLDRLCEEVVAKREAHCARVDELAIRRIQEESVADCADNIGLRFIHSDDDMKDVKQGEKLVLCPSEYTVREVERMLSNLGVSAKDIALQLPIIANGKDIVVIEKLLASMPDVRTLVSENIYGFKFAGDGYEVISGAGHNVLNRYAVSACRKFGAAAVLPSIEREECISSNELPLMTFAHCPYKTVYGNDCAHCSYKQGMELLRDGRRYAVRRTRISQCYFGIYPL